MAYLTAGTEQDNANLVTSQQLLVDAGNNTYTVAASGVIQAKVQLGNTANPLVGGSTLAITVKVLAIDTGEKCVYQQKTMNIPIGDTFAMLVLDMGWLKVGDIIEVHAKSSGADSSVGAKVWLIDVTPATATEMVTTLFASTGVTAGGTWSFSKVMKVVNAFAAGMWRDKAVEPTTKELLDPDDGTTVILEAVLSSTTPYVSITVLI